MTLLQLKTFKEARDQEVAEYQLNINNYIRAIAKIESNFSDNKDMQEFRETLLKLLADNKKEQLKSIIMKDALVDPIVEVERP
jgi:two-component sensor histidine kinase